MKIDIQIEDNRKHAAIAFLVDRDDFLADIQEVRERIKLSKIPYIFPTYPYEDANRIIEYYKKDLISVNGVKEILEDICEEKGLLNLYALDKTLGTAVIFAESLAKKYGRNYLYIPAILASILVAKVSEDDFLATQIFEINSKIVHDELSLLQKDEEVVTIRVNRESTMKEVQSIFDFIQKYYFKVKPTDPNDGLNSVYDKTYYDKPSDTVGNIERDREWYWLKKEGWSYQEIRRDYIKKTNHRIILRGVQLAIKRYISRLNSPL